MSGVRYIPKSTVSGKAMRLIMEIAAALERYKIVMEGSNGVRLRKLNHIRTIRGTTAIEGNTLSRSIGWRSRASSTLPGTPPIPAWRLP